MGKLTARSAASLAKRKGRWGDGDALYLRVLEPGKRVYWTYKYQIKKVEREKSIGSYFSMTLAEARDRHLELRAMVARGVDPLAGKHGGKGAVVASGVPTFGAAALKHIEAHQGAWKSSKHERQYSSTLRTYAAAIWDMPVSEVDTTAIVKLLEPVWTRATASTRARTRDPVSGEGEGLRRSRSVRLRRVRHAEAIDSKSQIGRVRANSHPSGSLRIGGFDRKPCPSRWSPYRRKQSWSSRLRHRLVVRASRGSFTLAQTAGQCSWPNF